MQTSKEDKPSNELPCYEYISDEKYYELYESGNYLGIACVKGFFEYGQNTYDKTIYLQFGSNDEDLIKKCIDEEVVQTNHSDWVSYAIASLQYSGYT